jgi:hypothetical protein
MSFELLVDIRHDVANEAHPLESKTLAVVVSASEIPKTMQVFVAIALPSEQVTLIDPYPVLHTA